MNKHNIITALTAGLLASCLSAASILCLATGFDLPVDQPRRLIGLCCAAALAGGLLFQLPRSKSLFLIICILPVVFFWHSDSGQFSFLLRHVGQIYNTAYHWNLPLPAASSQSVDIPLMVWGYLCAAGVSYWVCQGKGLTAALVFPLLPLGICLVVTDTVPDTLFLFLIFCGCAIILLTAAVRRRSIVQGNRLTAAVTIPIAIVIGLIFLLTPQKDHVQQARMLQQQLFTYAQQLPRQLDAGVRALSDTMELKRSLCVDLSNLGSRQPSDDAVMTVTTGQSGPLYLRRQDYDRYTGTGWIATAQRTETLPVSETADFTITIRTRTLQNALYIPCYPAQEVTCTGGRAINFQRLREYSFVVGTPSIPAAAPDTERYLALPDGTREKAEKLLQTLCSPANSPAQTADAITEYLQSCAIYDLQPPAMPRQEPDFALWFLQEADSGYCVHFATAAVVLLRAYGIPARYVTGYLTHAQSGIPNTVVQADAHAWAEFYDADTGCWRILDATPPAAMEAFSPSEAAKAPVPEDSAVPSEATSPANAAETRQKHLIPWLYPALVLFFALVMILQRSIRLLWRKHLQNRGSSRQKALARWSEAEFLSRLLKQVPTEELLALAQKASFSHHELTDPELEQVDSYLRSCRKQLRQKHWYIRWIHQYLFAAY